ncbi:MAG: PKD domain-containing protein, partial [Bacteroidales bacterium]|nr:PKD domain-containing protein [Bacteroidales bacterium]
ANGGDGGTIYFQGTTSGGESTVTASTSEIISTSGTYYFRSQSVEGCWGDEGSASVTINTIPDPVTVTNGGTQCGGTTTLTANGGDGGTIYFQGTTSGGESTVTASTSEIISTSGTYYFRSQSAEGCWGDEGSAIVTIYPVPVVDLGDDQQNCGEYITFDAGSGFTLYVWNGNPYGQTLEVGVSGDYTVVVTDENGCTATDMIHVDIFDPPYFPISVSSETSVGGADGSISLDLTYVNSPQITWSTDETTPTISGLSAGYYYVTVEDINGCSTSETVFVPIEVIAVAEFTADQTSLCGSFTVSFTDESQYFPTSWDWDFGDGHNSNEQNPIHEYTSFGLYSVKLTVGNATGDNEIIKTDYISIGETPEIDYIVTPATGKFAADGAISVSLSGGTEPYSVLWNHDAMETSLELTNLVPGLYYVTVTEAFNCAANEIIEVDWVNMLDNLTDSFSMYPNPTETQVTIVSEEKPILSLIIVNVLGEVVYKNNSDIHAEQFTISTKDFASGTYFIKVEFKDDFVIQKLIKR